MACRPSCRRNRSPTSRSSRSGAAFSFPCLYIYLFIYFLKCFPIPGIGGCRLPPLGLGAAPRTSHARRAAVRDSCFFLLFFTHSFRFPGVQEPAEVARGRDGGPQELLEDARGEGGADEVMADVVMAYIVMDYIVVACIVMAYVVMAYVVMAYTVLRRSRRRWRRRSYGLDSLWPM